MISPSRYRSPVSGQPAVDSRTRISVAFASSGAASVAWRSCSSRGSALGDDVRIVLGAPADHALHHVQPELQSGGVDLVGHRFEPGQAVGELLGLGS